MTDGFRQYAAGADDRSGKKTEHEERKDPAQPESALPALLARRVESKRQRDRHNHQRAGQLDDRSVVAGVIAVGIGGRDDGGSIVDRRPGPHAEACIAEAQQMTGEREDEDSGDVEKKDGGDRICDFFVVGGDDGSGCRDCTAAADRGADADQDAGVAFKLQCAPDKPGGKESSAQCEDDYQQ